MATISGTVGSDFLVGTASDDTISGNYGDDIILGMAGDDLIYGEGDDDTVLGGDGNDEVYGGQGNDSLFGDGGNDLLYGGDGNDHLRGGPGVDFFDGGNGSGFFPQIGYGDRVSFFDLAATQGAIADLRTGLILNDGFGNAELMVGIESLGTGTAFADEFYGNTNSNSLFGGTGDTLMGFEGDDDFQANGAPAILDGGSGTDFLRLQSSTWLPDSDNDGLAEFVIIPAGYEIDLTAGTIIDGLGFSGTITGIENIHGDYLDDTILGDNAANTFEGAAGNDILDGRGGDDKLDGGLGQDTLTGGIGSDTFVFTDIAESLPSAPDLITDFDRKEDFIDLSGLQDELPVGAFLAYSPQGFTGTAGEFYLEYSKAEKLTHLKLDADGDGSADMVVHLLGNHSVPPGLLIAGQNVPSQVDLPFLSPDFFIL